MIEELYKQYKRKFRVRYLFLLTILFSLSLHFGVYASYYIATHRTVTDEVIDGDALEQDVDLIEEIPPELIGGTSSPAPVEKKDWVEGSNKNADDPVDDDINENAISGNGTDKDGFLYSFNGDKVPTPIIDFDLKQFFPDQAKAANINEKVVVVLVQIDETGKLVSKKIVSGKAGFGFDEAALKIISLARFTPGYLQGKPVKMTHRIPINFTLDE
ncbi:MAG: energy transducer TonB [Leptospiraceae bacterium]|nr:energy transducer TonB [Leptospiraceae bacterium]